MQDAFKVILVAASPVLELRGSIPYAISLGFKPGAALLLSIAGNILPVPLLLIFFKPVSERLRQFAIFKRFFQWLDERTLRKSKLIQKYELLGLILFVAIPFPTTGAWTGSLVATMFKIKFRSAFLAILAGIIIAAIVVTVVSVGGFIIFN